MNKKTLWLVGIVVVVLIIIGVSSRTRSKTGTVEPIKIGVLVMLTGDAASWGVNAKSGIDMAVDEYNTAHPEKPVQTIYADTKSEAAGAVSAFTKVTNIDKVQFVIGPLFQHELAAVDPLIQQKGIPVIAPGYYPKENRSNLKNPLLMWLDALVETDRIADYIVKQGAKSVSVINSKDPWETAVANEFNSRMKAAGVKVLASETVTTDATDDRLAVSKLLAGKPDAVFVSTYFQYIKALKALGEQQYKGKVYSIEIDEYLAGETKNFFPEVFAINPDLYKSDFSEKFQKKYGTKAGMPAGHAYDAANILLSDIAKDSDPKSVMEDFRTRTSYEGVSGTITFTSDGKTLFPTALYNIKDGSLTRVAPLE